MSKECPNPRTNAPTPPPTPSPTQRMKTCERPRGWCGHRGSTYTVQDCDGDGTPDTPTCVDTAGNSGTISPFTGCKSTWPRANMSKECPKPTNPPTLPPTPSPTPRPTESPTRVPTMRPTPSPTTASPSGFPTTSPTGTPTTLSPTTSPTTNPRTCPVDRPADGDRCGWTGRCEYGEETCCQKTHPSYIAECHNGIVMASDNDICKNKVCDPSGYGDPHFRTWSGHDYDFHGGCDLVLLTHPNFENGLGLNIHIRTRIKSFWSYIEAAAIQIGTDVLEVQGGANSQYFLNGKKLLFPHSISKGMAQLGNFAVKLKAGNKKMHQHRATVFLLKGETITIDAYADFVRVNIRHKQGRDILNSRFLGSLGLLGDFPMGNMTLRDGVTKMNDPYQFGQHWMVQELEPFLFHNAFDSSSGTPGHCQMPEEAAQSLRRYLADARITQEEAEEECTGVPVDYFAACVHDVIATQNKNIAGSYGGGADGMMMLDSEDDDDQEEEEMEKAEEEVKKKKEEEQSVSDLNSIDLYI